MSFVKVFDFMSDAASPPKIQRLGTAGPPRTCRFCTPATARRFKERKHVIPEALGNKSLFSLEECDDCNQRASQFENDLAVHLILVRLFSRLPGKATKGRTREEFAHRFGKDDSKATRTSFGTPISIGLVQGETSLRIRRIENGFTLSARVPTYRLLNVAKALVRMAVFACDDADLSRLAHCVRWLRGAEVWPVPVFWQAFVPKTSGQHVGLILQRNVGSPDESPYILHFTYAGMFLGIGIPDATWSPPKTVVVPNFGAFAQADVVADLVQFKGDGLRDRPTQSMDVQVPALEGVAPPTDEEIALAAHERFVARGRVDRHDLEDWLDAEQDLLWKQVGRPYRTDTTEDGSTAR